MLRVALGWFNGSEGRSNVYVSSIVKNRWECRGELSMHVSIRRTHVEHESCTTTSPMRCHSTRRDIADVRSPALLRIVNSMAFVYLAGGVQGGRRDVLARGTSVNGE